MTSTLHAMAPPAGADPAGAPNPLMSFLPLIVIFVLFYFLFIRPQQKTQNERKGMIDSIKEGDQVVLISGIYATVHKVDKSDDSISFKIAENVVVKGTRQAVDRLQK